MPVITNNTHNRVLIYTEGLLIILISLIPSICLYPSLQLWTILVFFSLLLIGIITTYIFKKGCFTFSVLSFSATIPAITSYNIFAKTFTYLGVRKVELEKNMWISSGVPEYEELIPGFTFQNVLILSLLLVVCCIGLSFVHSLRQETRHMYSESYPSQDIEILLKSNMVFIEYFLILSLIAASIIIISVLLLQPSINVLFTDYSWIILPFGISAVMLLGVLIYRYSMKRKV